MERWLRVLILSGVCALSTGCASLNLPSFQLPFLRDKVADTETVPVEETESASPVAASGPLGESPSIVAPVVTRRQVRQVKIDAEDFEIGGLRRGEVHDGPLRDDQDVDRRDRVDVSEGEDVVCFVDDGRWDLPTDDAVEDGHTSAGPLSTWR